MTQKIELGNPIPKIKKKLFSAYDREIKFFIAKLLKVLAVKKRNLKGQKTTKTYPAKLMKFRDDFHVMRIPFQHIFFGVFHDCTKNLE